jgi:membrane protein DedA with SNARE-associated domain
MKKTLSIGVASVLLASSFTGCETPGQSALAGAATGAAIGGLLHGRGDQALAGAAIGAGAGYVLGKAAQHERRRGYEEAYYEDRERLPYAHQAGRAGYVRSPHYPYNTIDVRGIPHGGRVVDPSTGRAFINP